MLYDYRCQKVILIQPEERKKRKTDRRDAAALSELLWVNRGRLLHGKPVRGLRQVDIADTTDQENRRLTTLRKDAGRPRTRIVNRVRQILRRHNLQWEMPTKRFPTLAAIAWLKKLVLPESRPGTAQACEQVRIGMLLHHFGDLRVKVTSRFLGLLNLPDQKLDRHRRGCRGC
jgi:hypothetical protein